MALHPLIIAALLAVPAASHAAAPLELFTAQTTGTITIAPDGRVADVELQGRRDLGASTIDGYETHIRGWRFEPVIENGVAVSARAHLRMSLIAAREPGSKSASFGVRQVWFMDPPAGGKGEPTGASSHLAPPVYPAGPLREGAGAEVLLRLELAADGAVARADAERVTMLGVAQGKQAPAMAKRMARAATDAAADWRLDGFRPGDHVRVPVRFTLSRSGWERMHPLVWEPAPWIVAANSMAEGVSDVAAAGDRPSPLKLLTALPSVPGYDEG